MHFEVRKIPYGWVHPKGYQFESHSLEFIPLFGKHQSYEADVAEWEEGFEKWSSGLQEHYSGTHVFWGPLKPEYLGTRYTEYKGPRPSPDDYMPNWSEQSSDLYVLYETTTRGTPISPGFKTPEELAKWLEDNQVTIHDDITAPYHVWLNLISSDGFSKPVETIQIKL